VCYKTCHSQNNLGFRAGQLWNLIKPAEKPTSWQRSSFFLGLDGQLQSLKAGADSKMLCHP